MLPLSERNAAKANFGKDRWSDFPLLIFKFLYYSFYSSEMDLHLEDSSFIRHTDYILVANFSKLAS